MLQQGLDPWRFDVEVTMAGWLAGEVLSRVEKSTPGSSVLGWCLPAATYTRYLCKRLRARFPTLPIIVGCWGGTIDEAETLA